MKEVRLNNGVMMPAVGFGVYQIPNSETRQAVLDALEVGYRLIDTAASYFNEKEVGDAIRQSGLKREDVFITSKLWVQDYEYEDALKAFDKSLKALGVDYIDLYFCINPTATTTPPGVRLKNCTVKGSFVQSVSRVFLTSVCKTFSFVNYTTLKDGASRDPLEPFRFKPLAEEPAPTGFSSEELFKKESLPFLAHGRSGRIGVFPYPTI